MWMMVKRVSAGLVEAADVLAMGFCGMVRTGVGYLFWQHLWVGWPVGLGILA